MYTMYDDTKFKAIKQDIAYALLYRPDNPKDKVVVNFLWKLLCCAVYNGMIEEQDVEYAIEASDLYDLPPNEQLVTLGWMRHTGNRYLGELSFQQETELRRLHELCMLLTRHGELSVLREIADMID
jgi:hypothetical protein